MANDIPSLDLDAYFARIGMPETTADLAPTVATLRQLHRAHLAAIPFENLDVRLGRPVRLDLASLQAKLVAGRRGGYCFEQNALFAAVLRRLGFAVATLEARVRPSGVAATLPRTHMVLRVGAEGHDLLADVGFGGDGPLYPVPLDGEPSPQASDRYRVDREEDGTHVLRRETTDGWTDLYGFGLVPALPVDYEVAHHFTATHPSSPFVRTLTVQRSLPEVRHVLRGRTYVERRGAAEAVRELDVEGVVELLGAVFALEVPAADVRQALRDG